MWPPFDQDIENTLICLFYMSGSETDSKIIVNGIEEHGAQLAHCDPEGYLCDKHRPYSCSLLGNHFVTMHTYLASG